MSEIKVDTLTGKTSAGDITVTSEGGAATQSLQQGLAKVWCNFEQTATHTVRDSLNISSLNDDGAGLTDTNYTSSFSNDDYVAGGHASKYSDTNENAYWLFPVRATAVYSTSSTSWSSGYSSGTGSAMGLIDLSVNLCTIHGDLA